MSGSGAWKNTVERERSGNRAVSGSYRRRCERWAEISTAPTPLTCSEFVRNGEIWVAKSVTWWLLNSVVCTIARVVSGHCGQCWRTDGLIHSVASRPPTLCNCPPSVHCRSSWLKNGLVSLWLTADLNAFAVIGLRRLTETDYTSPNSVLLNCETVIGHRFVCDGEQFCTQSVRKYWTWDQKLHVGETVYSLTHESNKRITKWYRHVC